MGVFLVEQGRLKGFSVSLLSLSLSYIRSRSGALHSSGTVAAKMSIVVSFFEQCEFDSDIENRLKFQRLLWFDNEMKRYVDGEMQCILLVGLWPGAFTNLNYELTSITSYLKDCLVYLMGRRPCSQ